MTAQELAEVIKTGFTKIKAPDSAAALSYILENIGNLSTSVDVIVEELDTVTVDNADLIEERDELLSNLSELQEDYDALVTTVAAPTLVFSGQNGVFGVIANETTRNLEIVYTGGIPGSTISVIGFYSGDSGAFEVTGNPDPLVNPFSLSTSTFFMFTILPQSYGYAFAMPIKALAANAGVAKTGTISLYDRFSGTAPDAPTGTRLVGTISLSKTYTP